MSNNMKSIVILLLWIVSLFCVVVTSDVVPSPSSPSTVIYSDLKDWITANNGTIHVDSSSLDVVVIDEISGRGVITRNLIPSGQLIFSLSQQHQELTKHPMFVIVDDEAILNEYFVSELAVKRESELFLTLSRMNEEQPTNFVALFLMCALGRASSVNERSHFAPFIRSLPSETPKLSFLYNEHEMKMLQGSMLYDFSMRRRQAISNFYHGKIEPLMKQYFPSIPYSLDSFHHALALVWSRTHSVSNNSQQRRRSCLVPLGDLINFSIEANVMSFTDKSNQFTYRAVRDILPGEQLLVSYSQSVPNFQLMMDYGFCVMNNEKLNQSDVVFLDLGSLVHVELSRPNDRYTRAKVDLLQGMKLFGEQTMLRITRHQVKQFQETYKLESFIDEMILYIIRILAMSPTELAYALERQRDRDHTKLVQLLKFVSKENEKATKQLVHQALVEAIKRYSFDTLEQTTSETVRCIQWLKQSEHELLTLIDNTLITAQQS